MSEARYRSAAQEDAEANVEQFRRNLGPFVVAAETSRMPMVFTDAKESQAPIIFANESFLQLTGYQRSEVLGQNFKHLLAVGADGKTMEEVDAAFHDGGDIRSDVHYRRKDGSEFWASMFISPVRDNHGTIVQYFLSFADLTKEKQDQAYRKLLVDELNHRVKNTLSTVQSIVSQALRRSSDREIIGAIESRLGALSRSHDLLTLERWESVGLCDVVMQAVEPFEAIGNRPKRISIDGENSRLTPKAGLAFSIAFNELCTNATKYGALSNSTGLVNITWKVQPTTAGERLTLQWQETGGPVVSLPTHQGFGSRVLERGLAFELQGKVDLVYHRDGLVCSIDVPLASIAS